MVKPRTHPDTVAQGTQPHRPTREYALDPKKHNPFGFKTIFSDEGKQPPKIASPSEEWHYLQEILNSYAPHTMLSVEAPRGRLEAEISASLMPTITLPKLGDVIAIALGTEKARVRATYEPHLDGGGSDTQNNRPEMTHLYLTARGMEEACDPLLFNEYDALRSRLKQGARTRIFAEALKDGSFEESLNSMRGAELQFTPLGRRRILLSYLQKIS